MGKSRVFLRKKADNGTLQLEVDFHFSPINVIKFHFAKIRLCLRLEMFQFFPKCVVQLLYKEWLEVSDICQLDTSLCNKDDRLMFLTSLSHCYFVLNVAIWSKQSQYHLTDDKLCVPTGSLFAWLLARELQIQCLDLYQTPIIKSSIEFQCQFALNKVTIVHHHLHGSTSYSKLSELFKSCGNLQTLSLTSLSAVNDCAELGNTCFDKTYSKLTSLTLTGPMNISNATLTSISSVCKQLTSFDLTRIQHVNNAAINLMLISNPALTSLTLVNNKNVTRRVADCIAHHCPHLTTLNLTFLHQETYVVCEALHTIAKKCLQLVTLSTNCLNALDAVDAFPALICVNIGGEVLSNFCLQRFDMKCPNVAELSLTHCDRLVDTSVEYILRRFPGLRNLSLVDLSCVTYRVLLLSAVQCKELLTLTIRQLKSFGTWCEPNENDHIKHKNLTTLNLSDNSSLTSDMMTHILHVCPAVKEVILTGCSQLDNKVCQ